MSSSECESTPNCSHEQSSHGEHEHGQAERDVERDAELGERRWDDVAVAAQVPHVPDPVRDEGQRRDDEAGDYTLRATPGDHLLVAGAAGRAPTAQQIVLTDGLITRGDVVLDPTPEPART